MSHCPSAGYFHNGVLLSDCKRYTGGMGLKMYCRGNSVFICLSQILKELFVIEENLLNANTSRFVCRNH